MSRITIYIIFTTLVCCGVLARDPAKIVTIDKLRWDFLRLEETVWNAVLDYAENNIEDKEVGPELMVVRKFGQFGDKLAEEMGEVCEYSTAKREKILR